MRLRGGVNSHALVSTDDQLKDEWAENTHFCGEIYQLKEMDDSADRKNSNLDHKNGNVAPETVDDQISEVNVEDANAEGEKVFTNDAGGKLVQVVVEDIDEENTNDLTALLPPGKRHGATPDVHPQPFDEGSSGVATYDEKFFHRDPQTPQQEQRFRCKWCCIVTISVLVVLGCFAFTFAFMIDPMIEGKIKEHLVINNGTAAWAHPEERPTFSVYVFNITNVDEMIKYGRPMKLQELGPYIYRLKVEKTDITWNNNNTVSYREKMTFHFDPNMTVGSEKDVVTTVNVPQVALATKAGHIVTRLMNVDTTNPFVNRTVKELLWGYESRVLRKLGSYGKYDLLNFFPDVHNLSPVFSYLKDQNGTSGPLLNVYTGAGDFSKFNKVFSWGYMKKLNFWSSNAANTIRGTDGSMFQPFLDESSKLTIFFSQLFRTFDLAFQDRQEHSGVHSLRFIIPDSQFSNTILADKKPSKDKDLSLINDDSHDDEEDISENEKNIADFEGNGTAEKGEMKTDHGSEEADHADAYAEKEKKMNTTEVGNEEDSDHKEDFSTLSHFDSGTDDDFEDTTESPGTKGGYCLPVCLPKGVYSIESISQGAPLAVSLPHFLGADPYYTLNIKGLKPTETLHRPVFDVDEVTGVTVYNRRRHQINIRLNDDRISADFIPLIWADIAIELNPKTMSDLALAGKVKRAMSDVVKKVLIVLGSIVILVVITFFCFWLQKNYLGIRYRK